MWGDCAEVRMVGAPMSWVGVSELNPGWGGSGEGKAVQGSVGDCGWLSSWSCVLPVGCGGSWTPVASLLAAG